MSVWCALRCDVLCSTNFLIVEGRKGMPASVMLLRDKSSSCKEAVLM